MEAEILLLTNPPQNTLWRAIQANTNANQISTYGSYLTKRCIKCRMTTQYPSKAFFYYSPTEARFNTTIARGLGQMLERM